MILGKKILRLIAIGLISIIITAGVTLGYERYLDKELFKFDEIYNSEIGKLYGTAERDKGITLLKNAARRNELMVLGSSELASEVPQNIKNMFPNADLNCNVNIIGKAYTQSLLNTIKVGSLGESLREKRLVIIVSLQWFLQWVPTLGNEIDVNGYNSNFSELQFYEFMNNKSISSENKVGVCSRTLQLSKNEVSLQRTNILSWLYSKNDFVAKAILSIMKPYYTLRQRLLKIRDKHQTLRKISEYKNKNQCKSRGAIDWAEEEKVAERMGKELCTNNNFYIYDDYYKSFISEQLESYKELYKNADLTNSKEWNDYELFLKVCKELEVKPYLIVVPTNGYYYDFTELSQEKRTQFYDKIEFMAKNYGFDYLDMREKEYEPYFFKDTMHLGWKGWLYVSRKIAEYYS